MTRALHSKERSDVGASAPIERPRVVARLAASASFPITLVVAPAGYGKSVIIRQYLYALQEPRVRFALRAEHETLLGFLRGLTEALSERAPHAMSALSDAFERSTASPNREADLARWLHAHLEGFSGVVAIDDLHVADADAGVAQFLSAFIERTKGSIRWILATRSVSGLPVGTWLAYRDADLPIDEQTLRFTAEESREAADRLGLAIVDEELRELLELTEGWPAAMSFALRSSTRSSELRNVSALTREMIFRLLAEQVYAALSDEDRTLLDVAVALPVINVKVLQRAGFDRALTILERLRERTSFIYEEQPGIYQCHDLFRDFLRRQSALGGKRSQQAVHGRAARALEASGDAEHALAAYVSAESEAEIVRLLERHGFDLLERARGDVVVRAIEAIGEKSRRENASVLALQGALQATVGKFARAESLFRRALALAKNDRDLVGTVSLRLASILANQRRDVTELLNVVGYDAQQSTSHRVEALSLIAGQRAVVQDSNAAKAALQDAEILLQEVESEPVRARCLHRIGIALHYLSSKQAFDVLTQSAELAGNLHLYSIVSRANAVLSNVALHERDDVDLQLEYARAAATAAMKGGDAFALQTALLQMLGAFMRRGEIEKSIEVEQQLAPGRQDDLVGRYLAIFRSQRLAWEGRFSEAHRLIAACWAELPFDFDRIVVGSQYALFLALDSQGSASMQVLREISTSITAISAEGIFRERSVAVSMALCALAELANNRVTYADRLLNKVRPNGDEFVELVKATAETIVARLRQRGSSGHERIRRGIVGIKSFGYADVALLLESVERVLSYVVGESSSNKLTAAEVEILQLLRAGLTPKDIASRKGRSVYTVRVHIANAIAKLGCRGRSGAISAAERLGLL